MHPHQSLILTIKRKGMEMAQEQYWPFTQRWKKNKTKQKRLCLINICFYRLLQFNRPNQYKTAIVQFQDSTVLEQGELCTNEEHLDFTARRL